MVPFLVTIWPGINPQCLICMKYNLTKYRIQTLWVSNSQPTPKRPKDNYSRFPMQGFTYKCKSFPSGHITESWSP